MKKKYFKFLMIILCLLSLYSPIVNAIGVRPLIINMDMKPGEINDFSVKLLPGNQSEKIKVSFYKIEQNIDGSLTYKKPGDDFVYKKWIDLKQKELLLNPGKNKMLEGSVRVPYGVKGSHILALMIEPQIVKKDGSISILVRYAVRLNISVNRSYINPKIEISEMGLSRGKNGKPEVRVTVSNVSPVDFLVSGEAVLRDSSRKLITRIPILSQASMINNKKVTRLFPKSNVVYKGKIDKRLSPGKYTLRIFMRYGEHGQVIKSKKITIKEGQFNYPDINKSGIFSFEPETIEISLKGGQRKTEVIKLSNKTDKNIKMYVQGKEIDSNYKYSNLDFIELKSENKFMLPAKRDSRVILTAVIPRETKNASYHSKMQLIAYDPGEKKIIEKKEVPISVLVGDRHKYSSELKSLYYTLTEQGYLFSINLNNNGNVVLNPQAELIIYDIEDKFVNKVNLTLSEGEDSILPLQSKLLKGTINELKPGDYNIKINVISNGEKINSFKRTIEIKEK